MNNIWEAYSDLERFLYPFNVDVVVVDESLATLLDNVLTDKSHIHHDKIRNTLDESPCKFLLINRDMQGFPIDYKSVYKLVNNSNILYIDRLFPDYLDFNPDLNILTEDSKTGFEYYQHWFPNVETSYGKNNLRFLAKSNTQIVDDGSALGLEVSALENYKLYLPESFEYDLSKAWKPDDCDTLKVLEPDNSESTEIYFETKALPALCEKHHLPKYSKNKRLHPTLLNVQVHKDNKLQWCRDNAPNSLKNLSDEELLEIMNQAWNSRKEL